MLDLLTGLVKPLKCKPTKTFEALILKMYVILEFMGN